MKIVCPGCGAEIDTETLHAKFPPEGPDPLAEPQADGADRPQPKPQLQPPAKRRSMFLR